MTVQWRKSSYSGGADDEHCVELGGLAGGVGVRDSKDPAAGVLVMTAAQLGVLVAAIKRRDAER